MEALTFMSWKRLGPHLKNLRRATLPGCKNLEELGDLLNSNVQLNEMFGLYRGDAFYRATISIEGEVILIFGVDQLISEIPLNATLYGDGTFGILPLDGKQLYLILADIAGKSFYVIFNCGLDNSSDMISKQVVYYGSKNCLLIVC